MSRGNATIPKLKYDICSYDYAGMFQLDYCGTKYNVYAAELAGLKPQLDSGKVSVYLNSNYWRYVTLDDGETVIRQEGPNPANLRGFLHPANGRLATSCEIGWYHRMHPDRRSAIDKFVEHKINPVQLMFPDTSKPSDFEVDWHAVVHAAVEKIDPNRRYPHGFHEGEEENMDYTNHMIYRVFP